METLLRALLGAILGFLFARGAYVIWQHPFACILAFGIGLFLGCAVTAETKPPKGEAP
jgi:hypothetical protein